MLCSMLEAYWSVAVNCRECWVLRWRSCLTGTPRASRDPWPLFQMWWLSTHQRKKKNLPPSHMWARRQRCRARRLFWDIPSFECKERPHSEMQDCELVVNHFWPWGHIIVSRWLLLGRTEHDAWRLSSKWCNLVSVNGCSLKFAALGKQSCYLFWSKVLSSQSSTFVLGIMSSSKLIFESKIFWSLKAFFLQRDCLAKMLHAFLNHGLQGHCWNFWSPWSCPQVLCIVMLWDSIYTALKIHIVWFCL